MKPILFLLIIVTCAGTPALVRADDGSEVVVVYNKNMAASKAVAEYYAKMRHVPSRQVYGFDLTTNEEMSRAEFTTHLQQPLAKKLEADGFWKFGPLPTTSTNGAATRQRRVVASKIRYAALCYGVPLKIAEDPASTETPAPELFGLFRRNSASVDSELVLLPLVEAHPATYGPFSNWTYGTTNLASLNPTNGILLVARLDGPTADIARGLVDKALAAERDGLWGRGYFDARGLTDTNYLAGDQLILGAANIWKVLGYETITDNNPGTFRRDFPMSQIALYVGWYDQEVSGPFRLPKVEFMPGAFAYHLHSYSAATIRSATNNWAGPLLAKGATCTMGCVDEPSLQFTPNIALFLERWSISQYTFAEAAWASQLALSWQTTVIGDPLYQPFGKLPQQLHDELSQRNSPLIEWSYLRIINGVGLHGTPVAQLIEALKRLPLTTNSAVLTEKIATLYDAEGDGTAAFDAYENVLKLNPSPEQRIHIHLLLADKLETQGKKKEAYDELRKIISENPDYRDKFEILKRLLNLAIAIGDKDEITRCTREMQENPPVAD